MCSLFYTNQFSYPRVNRNAANRVVLQHYFQVVEIGHARELENRLILLLDAIRFGVLRKTNFIQNLLTRCKVVWVYLWGRRVVRSLDDSNISQSSSTYTLIFAHCSQIDLASATVVVKLTQIH